MNITTTTFFVLKIVAIACAFSVFTGCKVAEVRVCHKPSGIELEARLNRLEHYSNRNHHIIERR